MISYIEALEKITGAVTPRAASERTLGNLQGCATAADVISRLNVPPFDNSAMDGFAVRAAETAQAGVTGPLELAVVGLIAAGDPPPTEELTEGSVEIMTGAPMPPGCDAVVPIERVEVSQDETGGIQSIRLSEPVESGRNVRLASQDFCVEQAVLASGSLIEPHAVMGLAATGTAALPTRGAPRIAVITTGSELTSAATPAQEGLICDSSGPYLEAFINHIHATLSSRRNVPDSIKRLEHAIAEAGDDADIVLTTGGVSAGRFDLVPDAVRAIDGEVLFHKVSIRPGKPLLFARLPRGNLLFGLPGNPIAVAACMRFFVMPAMLRMQGLRPERHHVARLHESFEKPAALRFFGKANAQIDAEGRMEVRLLPGQESFRISPLVKANCWAILDDGQARFEAGQLIRVAPLYPTGFLQ